MKKLIGWKKTTKNQIAKVSTLKHLGSVSTETKGNIRGYMVEGQGGKRYY
jgi:hypothetical protein